MSLCFWYFQWSHDPTIRQNWYLLRAKTSNLIICDTRNIKDEYKRRCCGGSLDEETDAIFKSFDGLLILNLG